MRRYETPACGSLRLQLSRDRSCKAPKHKMGVANLPPGTQEKDGNAWPHTTCEALKLDLPKLQWVDSKQQVACTSLALRRRRTNHGIMKNIAAPPALRSAVKPILELEPWVFTFHPTPQRATQQGLAGVPANWARPGIARAKSVRAARSRQPSHALKLLPWRYAVEATLEGPPATAKRRSHQSLALMCAPRSPEARGAQNGR